MSNSKYNKTLKADDMLAKALSVEQGSDWEPVKASEWVSDWKPVAVIEPNYASSIEILKLFKAPWLFCWLGSGDRFLGYLARNADIVGRGELIKNKHLSSKLIHSIITGDYGFSVVDYNLLSSHRNIDAKDVAYLLMDERTAFGVQYFSKNYIKGLHFLRDSGSEEDFKAYCKLGLKSSAFANNSYADLDLEDVRNFINYKSEEKGFLHSGSDLDWRQKELLTYLAENDTRFDVLMEVVSCKQASRNQRENAYAAIKSMPEFMFADMPEEWARKAAGMLPAEK